MKTNENKPLNLSKIVKRLLVGISTALLFCVALMGNYHTTTQFPYNQGDSPVLANLTINYRRIGDGDLQTISGNTAVYENTPTQYYQVVGDLFPAYITDADYYEVYHGYSGRWYNYPYEFVAEWNSNVFPIGNYELVKEYTLKREYDVYSYESEEETVYAFDYGILTTFATADGDYNYANEILRSTRKYDGSIEPITISLAELLPSVDLLRQNGAILTLSDGSEYINLKSLVLYEKRNTDFDYINAEQEICHTLSNSNVWTYANKIAFMGNLNSHISYVDLNPAEMLFQPLQAFLQFELMPGLSVQTLFIIALAIGIFGMFLKFYAGG